MVANIFLVHKYPLLLARIIKRLDDGQSHFFVHVDAESDINLFHAATKNLNNVIYVERCRSSWGTMGIVEASISLLRAVIATKAKYTHINLLSGQDYPLKKIDDLQTFYAENVNRSFIEHFSLPNHQKWQPNGGLYRVEKYFMGLRTMNKYMAKTLNLLARFLPFLRRKPYKRMKPFAGSSWWTITRQAAKHIVNFTDSNPGYMEFHQHTFAPDEVFFQTILVNASKKELGGELVSDNLRFIKWKNVSSAHPETISSSMIPELKSTKALFGRKFDVLNDRKVLGLVDTEILGVNASVVDEELFTESE